MYTNYPLLTNHHQFQQNLRKEQITSLLATYRNCNSDHSTCHATDNTTSIQHFMIFGKSNEKPSKLKRCRTRHNGAFASQVVNGPSSNDTSKHSTHCNQRLQERRTIKDEYICLKWAMKYQGAEVFCLIHTAKL